MGMPQTDEALAKILNKIEEVATGAGVQLAGRAEQLSAQSGLLYPIGFVIIAVVVAMASWGFYAHIPIPLECVDGTRSIYECRHPDPTFQGVTAIIGFIIALIFAVIGLVAAIFVYFDLSNWAAARDPNFALARKIVSSIKSG